MSDKPNFKMNFRGDPKRHIERTVIFIKSEAIQRHLIGEFITKFEKRGMKMIACKMMAPTKKLIGTHYPDDDAWYKSTGKKSYQGFIDRGLEPPGPPAEIGKWTRQKLIGSLAGRPLIAMIWQGPHAVALGRKTAGFTNPLMADIGSIRGDYSTDSYAMSDDAGRSIQTLVHASGSVEEAEREIKLWFKPEEILDYDLVTEEIIYKERWGKVRRKKGQN
jgi:nucleoside-diphosphate kinase